MNRNFVKASLNKRCAEILGISVGDIEKMMGKNIEVKTSVDRRIAFGAVNETDNVCLVLGGLLSRRKFDYSKISQKEVEYIRDFYKINVEWAASKGNVILSERVAPLILGVTGEIRLREFAKLLGIDRKDSLKLVKCIDELKSFLQQERTLSVLSREVCLSAMLQSSLCREKGDFSPLTNVEIEYVYTQYGVILNIQKQGVVGKSIRI